MAQHQLTLDALLKLDDGRVAETWNQALARVVHDMDDRPGAPEARQIELIAELKPVIDDQGFLSSCNVSFRVRDKIPQRKTRKYSMSVRKGGMLVFDELSTEDANQASLPFKDQEEDEES